jgi:hypothetical protein
MRAYRRKCLREPGIQGEVDSVENEQPSKEIKMKQKNGA